LVNSLYNIVDRIFIGKMPNGELAMAGLGVAMPIIILIAAFSLSIGNGGAPLAAIKMGKQDQAGAEKILGNSFSLLILLSIALTTIFTIFKKPISGRAIGGADHRYCVNNHHGSLFWNLLSKKFRKTHSARNQRQQL
jgi:Na+-driven multidrug efflux pump